MELPTATSLRIGTWCVNAKSGQISRDGQTARLELRTMRLLLCLAEHAGEVVSIDDLVTHVWSGVAVSPDSVYQAVASLRRILGDDPRQPTYIATVPRLGYRMVAMVTPGPEVSAAPSAGQEGSAPQAESNGGATLLANTPPGHPNLRNTFAWVSAVALCIALGMIFLFHGKAANNDHLAPPSTLPGPQKSVAVLPFLDLTESMKEEEFADGMTEELIDKISKLSGFRVPPPTSSFFYKGKKIPVVDIAHALNVAYVLDGSVRKSGPRLRVDARLIRADNGYVVWAESYDRPFDDILMVQDDIAGEVTKALKASIDPRPDHQ